MCRKTYKRVKFIQTFLPYSDFISSAKVLDNKRLGKQRVEVFQILKTLYKGNYICSECENSFSYNCCGGIGKQKITPWYNHPAVQMWKGYEQSLITYGIVICDEWTSRGYKDTLSPKIFGFWLDFPHSFENYILPKWIGNQNFHASHRSNLLRKNQEFYSKYNWKESNDLPYVWPTKIIYDK